MSKVRAEQFTNKAGSGGPDFPYGLSGIGIHSSGTVIHSGIITALNFVGTGNTFAVNGTTVDISISGGSDGIVGIDTAGISTFNGLNVTGISTFNQLNVTGSSTFGNITAGISTFNELNVSGNVSIAGTLTYEDVTNIDSVGLITARSGIEIAGIITAKPGAAVTYYGDGSQLSGISVDSTSLVDSNSVTRVQANTSGTVVTGILTATSFSGDGSGLTFAPRIIAFDPPALSTDVVVEKTITITFDQNISFSGNGTVELRSGSSSGTVIESFAITSGSPASGLSISGTQLIINPTSDLSVNTVVYVILPSSGIVNAAGNTYVGSNNYNFQTENVAYTISGGDSEFIVNDAGSPTNYYKYHIFSSSGPLTLSDPSAVGDSLYMMCIAGGGGGGIGGGGAGGLKTLTGPQMVLSAGSYTVTIGAGGNGYSSGNGGTPGGDTGIGPIASPTFFVLSSNGGGRGAQHPSSDGASSTTYFAEPGGSGGGVHGSNSNTYTNYGTGIPGQGNRGGANYNPQPSWGSPTGAGGGGAGGNGSNCINGPYPSPTTSAAITMGNGGAGVSVPEFAYPNIAPAPAVPANLAAAGNQYAGGGGGGGSPTRSWDNGSRTGGTASAGGGYGRWPTDYTGGSPGPGPSDGIDMTGGGGGGGPTSAPGSGSGRGGDGSIMIRYAVNWPA